MIGALELSGDTPLTGRQKFQYFFSNLGRNISGVRIPPQSTFWHTSIAISTKGSAGRAYMDAFLQNELPKLCTQKNLRVLDIGCGLCHIRGLLAQGGLRGTYTGVDIVREPHLDTTSVPVFQTTFIEGDFLSENVSGPFDLIISNTALEHISDDRAVILKTQPLRAEGGVEVHVVPSHWTLPLYLWHGYRQYSPGRIRKVFSGTEYVLYRLGGFPSFLLHFLFVTIPERFFGRFSMRNKNIYLSLKRVANRLDPFLPFCPIAYVIVIR